MWPHTCTHARAATFVSAGGPGAVGTAGTPAPRSRSHARPLRADVQAGRVARRAGIVRVSTVHGFTGGGAKIKVYEWLQVLALRRFEAVVVVSAPLQVQLEGRAVPGERLLLRNSWCGSAQDLDRVSAHRVRWCGVRAEAGSLFRAFDVFVLSSRTEGTPIVLLEAMQAEVQIVATSLGGVPDVVGPDDARLVAPGDPDALAKALRDVHADAPSANQRADAARRRFEVEFTLDPWLDAYERIDRWVAAAGGARSRDGETSPSCVHGRVDGR